MLEFAVPVCTCVNKVLVQAVSQPGFLSSFSLHNLVFGRRLVFVFLAILVSLLRFPALLCACSLFSHCFLVVFPSGLIVDFCGFLW